MRTIGKLATLLFLVAAGCGAAIGMRSIPDIQRYLKIRAM